MSDFYPDKYKEPSKSAPGNDEAVIGEYLVMAFRFCGIPMPKPDDEQAVRRVGALVKRWLRNLLPRRDNGTRSKP